MIGVHLGSCCTDVGEGGLRRCRFEREREREGRESQPIRITDVEDTTEDSRQEE